MLNHTIIVGGAEQTKDENVYQTPEWVSYGNPIDIVAPAANLMVGDDLINGTSFATPMVSGAAALVWSRYPDLTAKEVKERLLDTSLDHVVWKESSTKGPYRMLNLSAFLGEESVRPSLTETYLVEYPYYDQLLRTYRKAVQEQWGQDRLDRKEFGPIHYEPQPLPKDYGYELRDINGNGVPELLLGVYREDGKAEINEIYTLQNKKPKKVFESAIRTNVHMYQDGTIETCSSLQAGSMLQCLLYQLDPDGARKWRAGYEGNYGQSATYKAISDPESNTGKVVTQEELNVLRKKYSESKILDHSFTPFLSKKEKTAGKSDALSDKEIENIVKVNYSELEGPLMDIYLGDLFEQYHDASEGQEIWESGVSPSDPFYQDVYKMLYPEVKDLAAEEGMESLINEAFSIYWQPPAPGSFFGPSYDLEVLDKDSKHFKVKQTKEIGPQDVGGESYILVYVIDYVKKDGKWKFAGFKKEE